MKYICGIRVKGNRTAGGKAQHDIDKIMTGSGYKSVIYNIRGRKLGKKIENVIFNNKLKKIESNSVILIQYPIPTNRDNIIEFLKTRDDVEVILIIHDVGFIRYGDEAADDIKKIERYIFDRADKIIVHNEKMKNAFCEHGISKDKIETLVIFDYLSNDISKKEYNKLEVIVAGNLVKGKAQYVYDLNNVCGDIHFKLYGVNYTGIENEKVEYMGSFDPDELPDKLCGGFGLVWDGDSVETCGGKVGEYLRYNNPHKLSLYLASQIPVIVWSESAVADFVSSNKVGITVSSLNEISEKISNLSDTEYRQMVENTKVISDKLLSGYYTKKAMGIR